MKKLLLAASWLLMSTASYAQAADKYETRYAQCIEEFGTLNNGVVDACAGRVAEMAQRDVAVYYNAILAKLKAENPADAAKFQASQTAWRRYQESHCALAASHVGSLMYAYCPMKLTAARAQELAEWAGQSLE